MARDEADRITGLARRYVEQRRYRMEAEAKVKALRETEDRVGAALHEAMAEANQRVWGDNQVTITRTVRTVARINGGVENTDAASAYLESLGLSGLARVRINDRSLTAAIKEYLA